MKRPVVIALLAVLFVTAIGSVVLAIKANAYVVLDHQTVTQLLWNEKRAYVVVGMRRDGWSGSQAAYWWQVLRGFLGGSFEFNESRTWLVMATIEPNGVKRVIQDREEFRFMQPFESSIYTSWGGVKKWVGHQLEAVSSVEAARFKASKFTTEPNFSNVDGWSSRINLLNQGNQRFEYILQFDEKRVVVIADRTDQWHPVLTIRRGDNETITIVSVDERFQSVSAAEYDELIHKPLKTTLSALR